MIKIGKKSKIILSIIIICILIGYSIFEYKEYQYYTGYRLSTTEKETNIQEQLKQGNYDNATSLVSKYLIHVNDINDIIEIYKNSNDKSSLELASVEKTLEEKKAEEVQAQKAKEAAKSKVKETEENNTEKVEKTAGTVLLNKDNIKVICEGVAGSNYNYSIKIIIENNASNDISTVFNDMDINNIKLAGDSMISGIVKKGSKQEFEIKTGRLGILNGYFSAGDSTGHNITVNSEKLSINLNQVPRLN